LGVDIVDHVVTIVGCSECVQRTRAAGGRRRTAGGLETRAMF
jgi:hypothetical protein